MRGSSPGLSATGCTLLDADRGHGSGSGRFVAARQFESQPRRDLVSGLREATDRLGTQSRLQGLVEQIRKPVAGIGFEGRCERDPGERTVAAHVSAEADKRGGIGPLGIGQGPGELGPQTLRRPCERSGRKSHGGVAHRAVGEQDGQLGDVGRAGIRSAGVRLDVCEHGFEFETVGAFAAALAGTAFVLAVAGLDVANTGSLEIMAAVMAAGMVPPLAMALSSLVRPRLYSTAERENGKAAWLLGASFISVGAIPFEAADPFRVIPSMMLGGAVTGGIVMATGVTLTAPHGGLFVLFAMDRVVWFLIALAAGTVVAALAVSIAKSITRPARVAADEANPQPVAARS